MLDLCVGWEVCTSAVGRPSPATINLSQRHKNIFGCAMHSLFALELTFNHPSLGGGGRRMFDEEIGQQLAEMRK